MGINGTYLKVIAMGRLGNDPDVRTTKSGATVVNLNVATNHFGQKDQNGKRTEETEWTRVVLFGRNADFAAQYLTKGRKVFIEGRLKTSQWTDKDTGQDRYKTEVLADMIQGVDSPVPSQSSRPQNQGMNQQGTQPQRSQANVFDDWDADIPV